MKTFLSILCFCVLVAAAKDKPREWTTGTLLEVSMEKHSRLVGSTHGYDGNVHGQITQRRDDSTYYHVDAGEFIYIAKRTLTSRRDKQLKVTTNAPIKFSISGDDFYILDEDGKEHKLSIEEKVAKQKPSP
jgi:hypothetical protein